ncbi:MAG: tRNA preQ1(34) S-adenosylmethionine ribosyltransferase-isomerase QueA [Deltaproteobacteria bacterium]|nr:tRNA preQ1(34) S-adenosylmethionine ribosyltransferase-isomerase QueA [Deltaproteobacteria bacterium]
MPLSPKDFSYTFPPDLVARYPAQKRDLARLLVLHRGTGQREHKNFTDVVNYFGKGDVLVFNNSKVFPCRLVGHRKTGGRQEILLIRPLAGEVKVRGTQAKHQPWQVMINASRKVREGDEFLFDDLKITIKDSGSNTRAVLLEFKGELARLLKKTAAIPLPPYIDRETEEGDRKRYQTVYARVTGSVAAPTAGLHFTRGIIDKLKKKGVICTEVTLHVGPGTFLPVRVPSVKKHRMHAEIYSVSQDCCNIINRAKKDGRPVTAVGTTTTRVLESLALKQKTLSAHQGETDIFIYPPFKFKIVDRLITNFHLPESTLLMLVSAFAGREQMLSAYREAVSQRYRLFSYGDAQLIL